MKRLKGLRLKLPEAKPPALLADLYFDLRDRRLLPLVALVVVAIVAVPFLLGGDAEPLPEAPVAEGVVESLESGRPAANLSVVEAKPGLRDYRKRLKGAPTDPFEQRYTSANLDGAQLGKGEGGSGEGSGSGEKTSTSTTDGSDGGSSPGAAIVEEPEGRPPSDGDGEGGFVPPKGGVLFSFAVSLRIVHSSGSAADGTKETGEPVIRKRVLPTAALPSKETQVLTYMGLSPKTKKPTFLVSDEVTGSFGEGKCAAGAESCQLIELEPGFPQTFVFGEDGDRYKFKVTDVRPVVVDRT